MKREKKEKINQFPADDMLLKAAAVAGDLLRFNENYVDGQSASRTVFFCAQGLEALRRWGRVVHIE